jgi:hypothetical protein
MNERVQELADQAEDWADGIVDQGGEFHPAYTQKLAELIVRECMDILDPGEHQLIARFQARQWLAEHFGIDGQPLSNVDRILQTVRTRDQ